MNKEECNEKNCSYYKYLTTEVRVLLKKCKATMWSSGCEDGGIYGIEMNPKTFAKFLRAYDKSAKPPQSDKEK